MRKKLEKLIAVILTLCMLLTTVCFSVSAEESTCLVENITAVMERPLYENFDGEWYTNSDGERWFYYDIEKVKELTTFTVSYKNGDVVTGKWKEVLSDDISHAGVDPFGWVDGNNENNPWQVGGSYEMTCNWDADGFWFDSPFYINIASSPVSSVTAEATAPLTENAAGRTTLDELAWENYYHYDPANSEPKLTIKWKDTTKADTVGTISEIEALFGEEMLFVTDQSASNEWVAGKTYTATVNVYGVETDFEVTVASSAVKSISAKATRDAFVEIDALDNEWWVGDICYNYKTYSYEVFEPEITVTYENGFSVTDSHDEIYNKVDLWFEFTSAQQFNNVWSKIGEYTFTVNGYLKDSEASFSDDYTVKIIENPVDSISAVATLPALVTDYGLYDKEGNSVEEGTEGGYKHYYGTGNPLVTVNFADGTSKDMYLYQLSELYDYRYNYYIRDDQEFGSEWSMGKHTKTVVFMGREAEYDCYLSDCYVSGIKVIKTPTLRFEQDGMFTYNENNEEIFVYDLSGAYFTVELTLWDNSTRQYTVSDMNPSIDNLGALSFSNIQYEKPWTLGSDNAVTISVTDQADKKVSVDTTVKIVKPNDEFNYRVENGKAIITGYKKAPGDTITVPEEIDGYTVSGITNLYGWEYDETLTDNVKKIVLPDTVTMLSNYAFSDYSMLEEIVLGSGISNLPEDGFFYNKNLKKITVSEDNEYYCDVDGVVYNKEKTKLVVCPLGRDSVVVIADDTIDISIFTTYSTEYRFVKYSFAQSGSNYVTVDGVTYTADMTKVVSCDPAKSGSYTMPESVTSIASGAFFGCDQLTEVNISSKVTDIVYASFANCTALSKVSLPSELTSVSEHAFEECDSLKSITLPGKLETVGKAAFYGSGLTSLTVPDSVGYIGWYAFSYTPITSLDLGSGVSCINRAFSNCNELSSVTVPKNVESFVYAFSNCDKLSNVTLENGMVLISEGAFAECTSLKGITIPSTVETVEDFAFIGAGLTKIVIPDSVTYLGVSAFRNCTDLNDVTIGDGIETINKWVFSGCPVSNITWGSNVTTLGVESFSGMTGESIELPGTVTNIMYGAFDGSGSLSSIKLPTSVTRVSGHVFDNTAWFEAQPDGATYLNGVLYRYKGDITVPTTVNVKQGTRVIADIAFEHVPPEQEWWEGDRYYDLSGITAVNLPDSVEYIGNLAFRNLEITSFTIPDGVKEIGYFPFENCMALETVNIGKTTAEINAATFSGATYLAEINVDANNTKYASLDGVLYSKDMTTLIYCPRGKSGTLVVPASVTSVAEHAFAYSELDSILFQSAEVEFDSKAFSHYWSDYDSQYLEDFSVYTSPYRNYTALKGIAGSTVEAYADQNGHNFEAIEIFESTNTEVNIAVTETVQGSLPEGTVLKVEKVEPEKEGQVIFDITLECADEAVQPEAPVAVRIPLPEGMSSACKVYRLEEDGSKTDMKASYAGGYLHFTTEHFSRYILEDSFLPGDVSGDGVVNLNDVVALAQIVAGWQNVECVQAALNPNGDKTVDLNDVVMLAQFVAGWQGIELSTEPYAG